MVSKHGQFFPSIFFTSQKMKQTKCDPRTLKLETDRKLKQHVAIPTNQ